MSSQASPTSSLFPQCTSHHAPYCHSAVLAYHPSFLFARRLARQPLHLNAKEPHPQDRNMNRANLLSFSSYLHYRKKYDKYMDFSTSWYVSGVFFLPPCTFILNFSTMVQLTLSFLFPQNCSGIQYKSRINDICILKFSTKS